MAKRGLWTELQMERAMQAVRNGMAARTAAKEFNIPRRTLRNHLLSGSTKKKIGRPSCLTYEQEIELCERIFRLADVGMPLTAKVIRRSVYEYCQKNNIPSRFDNKGIAGRKWLKLFLGRHPDVSRRKSQSMNPARAAKLNRFIVTDYFKKLKEIMIKLEVIQNPQRIFNIDEKGCRLNLHKSQKVFARRGVKRVHLVSQEHAENVSIVACGNAIGQMISPMILFKGKRKKEEWLDNMPSGTVVEMTNKGSMTTSVFINWIHHFAKFKPPGKVLLIFDGASSHLDAGIVDAAESHDISLFCLPSNTTHELQPMDKAVFKAFESYWDDEVMTYWTNKPDRRITKFSFGHIFSKVWPKATVASNVISGFRATGIYPYDPTVIPDIAFAPSEITQQKSLLDTSIPSTSKSTPFNQQIGQDIGSSSESSDDDYSLHDTSSSEDFSEPAVSTSFHNVLITPDLEAKKDKVVRKKSLNYRAQEVTRALFQQDTNVKGKENKTKIGKKNIAQKQKQEQDKNIPGPRGIQKKGKMGDDQNEKRKQNETKICEENIGQKQKQDKNVPGPSGIQKKKKMCEDQNQKKGESWFCYLCQEDVMKDMRLCVACNTYVHEECVGLTAIDKENAFLCPNCD